MKKPLNMRLKRLYYRSWHRGCKETDLVLGRFADKSLDALAPPLVDLYEKLLDEDDADIWNWLSGNEPPPEYAALIETLKEVASD